MATDITDGGSRPECSGLVWYIMRKEVNERGQNIAGGYESMGH